MGFNFSKRPSGAPGINAFPPGTAVTGLSTAFGVNQVLPFLTSGTLIVGGVVKLTSAGTVKHTTGSSGRFALGILLTTKSTGYVLVHGLARVAVSTAAVKRGAKLRATSGAISATVGGTARATTNNTQNAFGVAITSAAAAATARTVLAFIAPIGRSSTAA